MIERREDAGDVAAGRTLIRDKPGLVPDRSNPDHLFHWGLTTRAGYFALWQFRHDTTHSSNVYAWANAPQFFWLRHTDLYGRKLSAKKIPARGRGRPARGHQRVAPMPIRRYLDDHRFDLETVRLMGIAFEMALASLRATPDHADPVREMIARKIMGLAQAGERDPERLCDGALKDLPQASKPP